jgi:hypothetical protein
VVGAEVLLLSLLRPSIETEKRANNHINNSASGHNIQLRLLCVRLCI